jgi:hypothetical protein
MARRPEIFNESADRRRSIEQAVFLFRFVPSPAQPREISHDDCHEDRSAN